MPPRVIRAIDYDAAAETLAQQGSDARVLGGGQSLAILVRLGFLVPEVLISLAPCEAAHRLELRQESILIGPRWTIAHAATDPFLQRHAPGLVYAAGKVASPHVRNFATVVGNICHADPANDLAAPLLCYDARVVARSADGERLVGLHSFFSGPYTTVLSDVEFAAGVEVRRLGEHRAAYRKVIWRGADHPVASAAVVLSVRDDTIDDARVAIGASVTMPQRLPGVERGLVGATCESVTDDVVRELMREEEEPLEFHYDPDIPARYRRSVSRTVVADAVAAAMADGGSSVRNGR